MIATLLKYSIGSLCWGLLLASALTALVVLAVRAANKGGAFTPPYKWLIIIALYLILIFNCTLISGAFAIKGTVEDAEAFLVEYVESTVTSAQDAMSSQEAQALVDEVTGHYPVLQRFTDGLNLNGATAIQVPRLICQNFRDSLNSYILQKSLWSIGFIVAALLLLILIPEKKTANHSRRALPVRPAQARRAGTRTAPRRTSF